MSSVIRRVGVSVAIFLLVLLVVVRVTQSFILRNSDGYKAAVYFVRKCPDIANNLGKPLQFSYRQGRASSLGGVPASEFEIAVTGERQMGNVYIRVVRENGKWLAGATNLKLHDGTVVGLRCD
jgi:cytochrome oxidase complex assembly protein 1